MINQTNYLDSRTPEEIANEPEAKTTNGESEKSHKYKTLEFYAHNYRDITMSENDLMDMLESFAKALNCEHECSSNCRKVGCNCACYEFHF